MYKYMTTQNNRLTPVLSNNLVQSDGVTKTQKQTIFENMSDGIITVTADGLINYVNSAATQIFDLSEESLVGQSFAETLLSSRKNKAFNRLFKKCSKKNCPSSKETVTYTTPEGQKHLRITISLVKQSTGADSEYGMLILVEDISDAENLKQHERDCALLFAGIVICITLYLSAWSLIRFTLHIPLKASFYTLMIEAMTLILFLEIIFFTSFSLKDVGLIPRRKNILSNIKQTATICLFAIAVLLVAKLFLRVLGAPVKQNFMGGSVHGAVTYLFTALLQEFLARGVIQTSVKNLMRVIHQIPVSIFLTSMLFTLMHLPYGFIFMMGAFLLSIALGILFEQQKTIWGCFFLHWSIGYLAMCLFF